MGKLITHVALFRAGVREFEERVNKRTAEKRIRTLVLNGTLKKHVVSLTLGHKAYNITLYEYLGLYAVCMCLAWFMAIL